MKEARKKARPVEATTGQASGTDFEGQYSRNYSNGKLSRGQARILARLGTDKDHAVSRRDLSEASGLDERAQYEAIRRLRVTHKVPVLSRKGEHGGYWTSCDSAEIRRFARARAREAQSELAVALALEEIADELDGQGCLDGWREGCGEL